MQDQPIVLPDPQPKTDSEYVEDLSDLEQRLIQPTTTSADWAGSPGWPLIQGAQRDRIMRPEVQLETQRKMLLDNVRQTKTHTVIMALEKLAIEKVGADPQERANLTVVADILKTTEGKNQASLSAEASLFGSKLDKIKDGRIVIKKIEKQGRDALYFQEKNGGLDVAHEVKSVTLYWFSRNLTDGPSPKETPS